MGLLLQELMSVATGDKARKVDSVATMWYNDFMKGKMLRVRCSDEEFEAWEKACGSGSLSAWVRGLCNAACQEEEEMTHIPPGSSRLDVARQVLGEAEEKTTHLASRKSSVLAKMGIKQ